MPQLVSPVYSGAFVLSILLQFHLVFAQSCYFPDGTNAPDHTPCNGSVSVSHCCEPGDTCLTTSLCYQAADLSINTGTCTDKTWKDPSCFQQCPISADYKTPYVNTLYRCDWNYWCCSAGGNETSCCNDPNVASFSVTRLDIPAAIYNGSGFASGFTVAPVQGLNTQSSVSALSSTSVTHPTTTGAPLLSAPACRNLTSSPNPTTVGIGAGLGVGIPLLIALGSVSFLLLRERRRSRNLLQVVIEGPRSRDQGPYNDISALKEGKAGAVELQGVQMEIEMQGSAQYHELPSRKASQSRR
ncbi:hypothetical protein JMJ35_006752 [Cladonia borealis]|uniref:Mid2 domain-containing protein n=1 Tax=Cladonia borealis TaxID=184061 RepID=A0AA39V7Y1_9LECA|nr:hypothetical protein JMJ35_006752 [Cladonia borealis]